MKYLMILVDGMADVPLEALGGKTPLEDAVAPTLDKLATDGRLGAIRTVPKGEPPETLAALFTLLGYPPGPYLTGRGYYEALASGLMLTEGEWAFRLQFVTSDNGRLVDAHAGGLTTEEGRTLAHALEDALKSHPVRVIEGHAHNHLLVVEGQDFDGLSTVSPFNIIDLDSKDHLPEGQGSELLVKLMTEANAVLAKHEINKVRVDLGQNPANACWIWGAGAPVDVPGFSKTFGLDASMISFSDLARGVGVAAGLHVIHPAGSAFLSDPSGRMAAVDSNAPATRASIEEQITRMLEHTRKELEAHQLVIVHFGAPDDFSHAGDAKAKVNAIEQIDRHFLKPLVKDLNVDDEQEETRITVAPTLISSVATRKHEEGLVPFLIWGPGIESRHQLTLTESNASETGIRIEDGTRLIDYMMNGL